MLGRNFKGGGGGGEDRKVNISAIMLRVIHTSSSALVRQVMLEK